jgi:hypothetical protein
MVRKANRSQPEEYPRLAGARLERDAIKSNRMRALES